MNEDEFEEALGLWNDRAVGMMIRLLSPVVVAAIAFTFALRLIASAAEEYRLEQLRRDAIAYDQQSESEHGA